VCWWVKRFSRKRKGVSNRVMRRLLAALRTLIREGGVSNASPVKVGGGDGISAI
jgi:hypothetical protein